MARMVKDSPSAKKVPVAATSTDAYIRTLSLRARSPVIIGCFDSSGSCNLLEWRRAHAKIKGTPVPELQVALFVCAGLVSACVRLCTDARASMHVGSIFASTPMNAHH